MVGGRWTSSRVLACALLAVLVGTSWAGAKQKEVKVKGRLVDVTLTEYAINMPESLTHGWATLHITNAGTVPHGLTARDNKKTWALTPDIPPGQTVLVPVKLRKGTFMIWCSTKAHADAGMQAAAFAH